MFFFSHSIYSLQSFPRLHTSQTCSPTLKFEPLIRELSPHFQKAPLLRAFLTSVAVSKHIGLAFKTGPLPTVGRGWSKRGKKKTSQVKFKDVFLLEARLRCHKPRETFSCSTFFMVSLRVSSLPFSLHLGSRVTYCCTGCRPQPAGALWGGLFLPPGPNRSPPPPQTPPEELFWLSLDGSHSGENPSENPPPGQSYLSFLSPPFPNNTLPTHSELMANSNRLWAESPLTYRPVFNVARKEPFYCRLQTVVLSQPCVV